VIILGSGDVGLIMARRLKFEGANVLGVVEILPYASGLPRNVVQCLDDYDIPLFLNHTITYIKGKERLESVYIAKIDKNMNIVSRSEKEIKCDTLLLSLGLIPENELSKDGGIIIDTITGGPIVNQNLETSLPGVFACGNCLQVYDTVDSLSIDAKHAGTNAAKYSKKKINFKLKIIPGKGIRYVIPQVITAPGKIRFTLRVEKPKLTTSCIHFIIDSKEILNKKLPYINPANMIEINVNVTQDLIKSNKNLEVVLSE
jgi:NADPH-dependent 2,4-dienoyl-CoA reductase/sulfur reductase-like enzyme